MLSIYSLYGMRFDQSDSRIYAAVDWHRPPVACAQRMLRGSGSASGSAGRLVSPGPAAVVHVEAIQEGLVVDTCTYLRSAVFENQCY